MTHQESRHSQPGLKNLATTDQPPSHSQSLSFQPFVLHIEELVLHGLALNDRDRIGETIRQELARLFAEQGVPGSLVQGGEIAHLDAGSFAVAPGASAEAIGVQVARTVYGGLRP